MHLERRNAVMRDVRSIDVMRAILEVHWPDGGTIADLTWGKGAFWKQSHQFQAGAGSWVIRSFDTVARYGCQVRADSRHSPLTDGAVTVAVFDPPHIHAPGKTRTTRIADDFGGLKNQAEGHQLIMDTAPELRRIASQGAVIKVTDMIESGRYIPTHALVMAGCVDVLGWPEDIAILDSGVVRPTRPNQRVLHLRHAHSFFLIYKWASRKLRSPLCA